MGTYIPSADESSLRQAQSGQLRGYLAFFDQIMSNHLAQLSQISNLLNVTDLDEGPLSTYFGQKIEDTLNDSKELYVKKLISVVELQQKIHVLNDRKEELSDKEAYKLNELKLDLRDKFKEVERIVQNDWRLYENDLDNVGRLKKKYAHPKIHDLLNRIYDAHQHSKTESDEEKEDVHELNQNIVDELKTTLHELMSAELLDQELYVSMDIRDLSKIISNHDDAFNRKDRLITHVLARFGEDFRHSFQACYYKNYFKEKSQNEIERDYLMTKSAFLNEVINANKYLAKGLNILSEGASVQPIARKLLSLLEPDIIALIASKSIINCITISRRLTSAAINVASKVEDEISLRVFDSTDKITFLVNSSKYLRYLFQYGANHKNYSIEQEGAQFIIYFNPPTGEVATKLIALDSESAAKKKYDQVLQYFAEKNESCQNFHVVEHILLRPVDQTKANYTLLDENKKNELFQSITVLDETSQMSAAKDAILLASYANNYTGLTPPSAG